MIGRIKGTLLETAAPDVLVDVQGVGYELQVPMTTLYRLPELNQPVSLHTHMVVREDAQLLYGFYDQRDRSLFRALIKVSGVGPKLGLAILSGMGADDFVQVIHQNNAKALESLPGVGKKTAERLIIEMRDKLKNWQAEGEIADLASGHNTLPVNTHQAAEEAEHALVALGYKPREAERAIKSVGDDSLSSAELIREALKSMAKV